MSSNLTFNLNKSANVVFNLMKSAGFDPSKYPSKVKFVLDISQSMANLYARGWVQKVVERIAPLAMGMDSDGELEVYVFHNRCFRVFPNVTCDNIEGYVNTYILNKYNFGGTEYAPAIDMILDNFMTDTDNVTINSEKAQSKSFNLWPFSKKKDNADSKIATIADEPTYVIFLTDGDAQDPQQAEKAITRASEHAIFFQTVGLASSGQSFELLKRLDTMDGRFIDNANFFEIKQQDFLSMTDDDFYGQLLAEYPEWIIKAQQANILKK